MDFKKHPRKETDFRPVAGQPTPPDTGWELSPDDAPPGVADHAFGQLPPPTVAEDERRHIEMVISRIRPLLDELAGGPAAAATSFEPAQSDAALRLLSHWGFVQRLDTAYLPPPAPAHDALGDAQSLIEERGDQLMHAALANPRVQEGWADRWLDSAAQLLRQTEAEASDDEDADDGAHSAASAADHATVDEQTLARQLLVELDDIELFACAGRYLNVERSRKAQLDAAVRRCVEWLGQHVAAFVPAAAFVRGILAACRPDLPGVHPFLSQTMSKYLRILGEILRIEDALSFKNRPPLDIELQ